MGQSGILKIFVQKQQKRHEKDSFVESFSLISELEVWTLRRYNCMLLRVCIWGETVQLGLQTDTYL